MTTITCATFSSYFYAGDIVSNTTDNIRYIVKSVDSTTTITTKKWNWIMNILSWNPCNELYLY